jgi:3-keto steroid reductase
MRPLFEAYAKKYSRPARMLWTSSLEGQPHFYSRDDWQLLKTRHAYEGSKYEIDLVASELERRSLQPDGEGHIVRHIIVHPGVVWSEMSNEMIWHFMNFAIGLVFYLVRLLQLSF